MSIRDITEKVRNQSREYGRYRFVSQKSNVSYEWLCKFAVGKIPNPTVENVSKLEQFFLNEKIMNMDVSQVNENSMNDRDF